MNKLNHVSASAIEEAFINLRTKLRPQGSAYVTVLRLNPGCAVNADVPQRAIDEIIKYHSLESNMGEPESACMQLAKILLADSAYQDFSKSQAEAPAKGAENSEKARESITNNLC